MPNIITARQAFKANGGANIANCATLKHLFVPYGKRAELIDYKAGVHIAAGFTSHGDTYSVPGTLSNSATTGDVADPGAANFGMICCWQPANVTASFILGAEAGNRIQLGQFTGVVVGASGTANHLLTMVAAPQAIRVTRSAAAATQLMKDGVQVNTSTTATGAMTLANNMTLSAIDRFYGCALFVFSGALPSNYETVMREIETNMLAGIHRLPPEIEDWT